MQCMPTYSLPICTLSVSLVFKSKNSVPGNSLVLYNQLGEDKYTLPTLWISITLEMKALKKKGRDNKQNKAKAISAELLKLNWKNKMEEMGKTR